MKIINYIMLSLNNPNIIRLEGLRFTDEIVQAPICWLALTLVTGT